MPLGTVPNQDVYMDILSSSVLSLFWKFSFCSLASEFQCGPLWCHCDSQNASYAAYLHGGGDFFLD